jgi:hypothetical protein
VANKAVVGDNGNEVKEQSMENNMKCNKKGKKLEIQLMMSKNKDERNEKQELQVQNECSNILRDLILLLCKEMGR